MGVLVSVRSLWQLSSVKFAEIGPSICTPVTFCNKNVFYFIKENIDLESMTLKSFSQLVRNLLAREVWILSKGRECKLKSRIQIYIFFQWKSFGWQQLHCKYYVWCICHHMQETHWSIWCSYPSNSVGKQKCFLSIVQYKCHL